MTRSYCDLEQVCDACKEPEIFVARDVRASSKHGGGDLISCSPAMDSVFNMIDRASQIQSTVLITGESGTGKDLAAQAIHKKSVRASAPLVAVNCAALPETLVEAELFGFEKGAFTGAIESRKGLFQSADGGTLFIDEIGDLALTLQAKFLRVLETRVVTPLGTNREHRVDVRILAATSQDLSAMLLKGTFREDLFYRLNVVPIHLPTLRDRREDIVFLAKHFLRKINEKHDTTVSGFTREALDALTRHSWPGNVRELLNAVEHAMVLCDGKLVDAADLPMAVQNGGLNLNRPALPRMANEHNNSAGFFIPLSDENNLGEFPSLIQIEHRAVNAALIRYKHNKTKAANALGISVRTLQRKLANLSAQ